MQFDLSTQDKEWRLGGKELTRLQISKMCQILQNWPMKTEMLILNQNNMDDSSVTLIAEAMKNNTSVNALFLQHNEYHEPGIIALCEMLQYNKVDVEVVLVNEIVTHTIEYIWAPFGTKRRSVISRSPSNKQDP